MRLPIRVRLTAWYAALLAAIIVALGAVRRPAAPVRPAGRGRPRRTAHVAGRSPTSTPTRARRTSATSARTVLPRDGGRPGLRLRRTCSCATGRTTWTRAASLAPARGRAPMRSPASARLRDGRAGRRAARRTACASRPVERARRAPRARRRRVAAAGRGRPCTACWCCCCSPGPAALVGDRARRLVARAQGAAAGRADDVEGRADRHRPARRAHRACPARADELGHLAVTLNAMLDRLEHGVAEQQRLVARRVARAAHAAGGDARRARRQPARRRLAPRAAREVLESAREEVDRMSRTVDNLLTLAQVDEGRLELLTTPRRPARGGRRRDPLAGAARRPSDGVAARASTAHRRPRARGRPAAPAPGAAQPHRERDQVHAAGRRGAGARLAHGRRGRRHGDRQRARHPAGRARARLRPLLPRRRRPRPRRAAAAGSASRSAARSREPTAGASGSRARRAGAARSRSNWRRRQRSATHTACVAAPG